ncbi:MAG: hypothetical protein Q7S66_01135 [bacterium]|nr:hypothetical protein [bacterium]
MANNFETYHLQKFDDVARAIADLSNLIERGNFRLSDQAGGFWDLFKKVSDICLVQNGSPYEEGGVIRQLISIVDINSLVQLLSHGKNVYLLKKLPESGDDIVSPELDDVAGDLLAVGLDEQEVPLWFKSWQASTATVQDQAVESIRILLRAMQNLKGQLLLISAYGHQLSGLKIYNFEDFDGVITDSEKYGILSTLSLLSDSYESRDGLRAGRTVLNLLKGDTVISLYTFNWADNFLFTVYLHLVFKFIRFYPRDDQEFILSNYAFRAIIAGVDVSARIKEIILTSTDVIDYLATHAYLVKALESSKETILFGIADSQRVNFGELLSQNLGALTDDSELLAHATVRTIFADRVKRASNLYLWVYEYVALISKLRQASLVQGSDMTLGDDELYRMDLLQLTAYSVNKQNWDKVVAYYKQPEPFVPLKNLFDEIASFIDLNKELAPEMMLEFTDFLRTNNILSSDKEIVIFDEKQGKFLWSK